MTAGEPLTSAQMEALEFERLVWKYEAAKETAVRVRFGVSMTRWAQLVNDIVDLPAAETYDAELVRRLRRLRDQRRQTRRRGLDLIAGSNR